MTEQNEQVVETVEAAQEENPLQRTLELKILAADLNNAVENRLTKLAKNARMPGFRKGHVPMKHVRGMYGMQAYDESLNELVGQAWAKAAQESGLRIAGTPRIDARPAADNEDTLVFVATFEVFPDVELPDFAAMELKRYTCTVTDENVEKTIDVMRKQRAVYNVAEGRAAADEDRVKLNFKGTKNGEAFNGGTAEGYVFVLGQGRMLPEFEEAVRGMKAGEKKTFPLTFPTDYGIQDLNGAEVEFEVEVLEVAEPSYPAIDDEFAAGLGVEGGVEKMKAEIRANLEREIAARIEAQTKGGVMEAVSKTLTFRVPAEVLNNECEALAEQAMRDLAARGMDVSKFPKPSGLVFKDQAERRIRLSLFVEKLVDEKSITVADEDVRKIAEGIAASYEQPEEVVNYLMNDANRRNNIAGQALETKVTEWILANAKTEDVAVEFDDVMANKF